MELALWVAAGTASLTTTALLVAVLWLPARAKRRFGDALVGMAAGGAFPVADGESESHEALRRRLLTRGTTYLYLLEPDGSDLRLTRAGRALAERIREAAGPPAPTRTLRRRAREHGLGA